MSKAPIAEALIDMRVRARREFKPEEFRKLIPVLADRYPLADEQRAVQAQFEMRVGQQPTQSSTDLGLQGLFFRSSDRLSIVQFRTDGFTFNRLRPYTSWERIFPEAMELWRMYTSMARPEAVTRLALRYIDHLNVPLPITDLSAYLAAPPTIPAGLPQTLLEFLTSVLVHDKASDSLARITQSMQRGADESSVKLILDVDTFKHVDLPPESREIESLLVTLRGAKNTAFFASFTEKALEPYS